MNKVCADCVAEVDHCHGTLIVHPGGALDCTTPGCSDLDGVRHDLRIDCRGIAGGCRCALDDAARRLVLAA